MDYRLSEMTYFRATFGAKENSHNLLHCDKEIEHLSSDLVGLTDRPPGHVGPNLKWWPSVGCGPVGTWWCLWWTIPDDNSARSGMVKSEVALWPIDKIAEVEDLTDVMIELSGQQYLGSTDSNLLSAIAHQIIDHTGTVVVFDSLEEWPPLIVALWPKLWGNIRRGFACRVALSPPQNGLNQHSPLVFAVPRNTAQQWQKPFFKLDSALDSNQVSRPAMYLSGQIDTRFEEVLKAIPPKTSNLSFLNKIGRIANYLDDLNNSDDPNSAIALLRTLLSVDEISRELEVYLAKALEVVSNKAECLNADQILALANVDLSKFSFERNLSEMMSDRLYQIISKYSYVESIRFIERLKPNGAHAWWQVAVSESIKKHFITIDDDFICILIYWLVEYDISEVLIGFFSNRQEVEAKIIEAFPRIDLDKKAFQKLRLVSVFYKWPKLHAWCVLKTAKIELVFSEHYKYPGDASLGLSILVDNLPPEEIVKQALNKNDLKLISIAAKLTVVSPRLLSIINVENESSRRLWASHISSRGEPMPEVIDIDVQFERIIDCILRRKDCFGLVGYLAEHISHKVIAHSRRSELWVNLNDPEKSKLISLVSEEVIRKIDGQFQISELEQELAQFISDRLKKLRPSSTAFVSIVMWLNFISERDAIDWAKYLSPENWTLVAEEFGAAVSARNWKNMAQELQRLALTVPEAKPAYVACKHLLPVTDPVNIIGNLFSSIFLPNSGLIEYKSPVERPELNTHTAVADICSSLMPDSQSLNFLWEGLGGRIQNLPCPSIGTPRDRWRAAVRQAHNGEISGGVRSLIQALKIDFPNNSDLARLERDLL